ncbi:MAG TPA: tetratricopeptide repeat protein [Verrucomicrobiae bacterium]|jgi:tetratricopeptide (TPR) repeat protein
MATEKRTDPRRNFVPRFLPWLLAAAALAVYCLTLNHWVSLFNCVTVAKVSGWTWQPEIANPISFLATYPFRWLPVAQIPIALNIFSAVCAALTLGLLARSVAILPQDRTSAQRKRELSDFSFLTLWSAWLPPVLAVLVCGLQFTFWEQATNCAGEMIDLLLFAFVIWSLLEYRLGEREWRLFLAAFVYGLGMAENWAMVGFFPIFVAAIIWIRRMGFFNVRFLGRMALCGLAGMLLYLLLPLLAVISGKVPATFWQVLKYNLAGQFYMVKLFFVQPGVRETVWLLSLTSLLPVLLMAIRWKSYFGDVSRNGIALTNFMFHVVHAFFLVMCVWVAFDPPFSPRQKGFGLPFLTFYYLGALSVGYFSGYFLLVFGRESVVRAERRNSAALKFFRRLAVTGVCLFAALASAGLVCRNTPQIRAANDDTFRKFTSLMEENLPRAGGILLCDDSQRLILLQSALARDGRAGDFVPLETQSLTWPTYHEFLHKKFPRQWPDTVTAAEMTNGISPLHLVGLLAALAKTNELYYLHPSFGYYFEEFYLEPHGMVYKLKTLPKDTLLPPSPDKNEIAGNEAFWSQAAQAFAPIEKAGAPPQPNAPMTPGEWLLDQLHISREQNPNLIAAGIFYSRSLDFFGVELQRAGHLTNAAADFETALELNPDNVVAQINLQFNQSLQAGRTVPVDLSKATEDQFGKYRTWNEVLNANGPFDEPSFCFEDGMTLARGGLMRQAIAPFERVRELAPDNLPARLWLGQLYLASRLPDRALDALREPLEQPEKFSLTETNDTQFNVLMAAAYFQKNDTARGIELLQAEIFRHPTDTNLLTIAARAYLMHGLFTNALGVIDRKLRLTPGDPTWLFTRGYVCIQLKDYGGAISALTRVLSIQTNNPQALYNRAAAYLDSGKFDDARADYEKLQQTYTNSFQAAYGLGEIAWRKHETNDAVKNYEIYLANAKTNTAEATNILQRLRELKK